MARTRYRLACRWLKLTPACSKRLLDVGAGNGAFLAAALRRSPRLDAFGAEYSSSAIEQAPAWLRTRLARCDLQGRPPLPWGGGFEVITCMEVLEHLPDDEQAITHLAQALNPSGRLFVSVPAWPALWGPQDEIAGHVRRYDPAAMKQLLERAGLRVLRMMCWGGIFCRTYLRLTDFIGPQKTMGIRPKGMAGLLAEVIFQFLKLDDLCSFARGPQLLVMACKAGHADLHAAPATPS